MQSQHDYLQSKHTTQEQLNKRLESDLIDYQQRTRDLTSTLEKLKYEKESSDMKAKRVATLVETVEELRKEKRQLEIKYNEICDLSMRNGGNVTKLDYDDIVIERNDYRTKVSYLQESVKAAHESLIVARQSSENEMRQKEEKDRIISELKFAIKDLQREKDMLHNQLRLYSGDDGLLSKILQAFPFFLYFR